MTTLCGIVMLVSAVLAIVGPALIDAGYSTDYNLHSAGCILTSISLASLVFALYFFVLVPMYG